MRIRKRPMTLLLALCLSFSLGDVTVLAEAEEELVPSTE